MKEFIQRLSSRKFLLTIALITLVTLVPDIPPEVLYIGLAFVGAEGLKDVVMAFGQAKVGTAAIEKDIALINMGETPAGDENKGTIKPGNSPGL